MKRAELGRDRNDAISRVPAPVAAARVPIAGKVHSKISRHFAMPVALDPFVCRVKRFLVSWFKGLLLLLLVFIMLRLKRFLCLVRGLVAALVGDVVVLGVLVVGDGFRWVLFMSLGC